MRSSIFISLALILSLQLVSSQDDLFGVWSNPITVSNSDLYCCVPTSITIEALEGTSNLKATYQFPSIFQQGYNAKCGSLFNGNVNGQSSTTVYKDASTGQYFIQKYDMSYFSNRNYIFKVSGGVLNVQGSGASSSSTCNFSMNTKSSKISPSVYFLIISHRRRFLWRHCWSPYLYLGDCRYHCLQYIYIFLPLLISPVFRKPPKETTICHYRPKSRSKWHHCLPT